MSDIDIVVKDLSDLISSIIRVAPQKNRSASNSFPSTSLINISVNITTRTLEESFAKVPEEKQYPPQERNEPLIDIIENKDTIRVIATLPGIRKEDVWFHVEKDVLVVEVTKYGRVYKKEIPCNAKADQISTRSSTLNNSVLEIVFDKAQVVQS